MKTDLEELYDRIQEADIEADDLREILAILLDMVRAIERLKDSKRRL